MRPIRARAKAVASNERGSTLFLPLAFLMLLSILAVAGCNTVSGMGEDVSAAGGAVSETSERTQDRINRQ